jgi:hypothetical protein
MYTQFVLSVAKRSKVALKIDPGNVNAKTRGKANGEGAKDKSRSLTAPAKGAAGFGMTT